MTSAMSMTAGSANPTTARYANCIEVSKRIRWEIDRDVIRGRTFDFSRKFLPDGLSMIPALTFLAEREARFLSQIQGRTYANMFALVERFIGAKVAELGHDHALGDQVAFEALVRLTDEELKHQELFRRLETHGRRADAGGLRIQAAAERRRRRRAEQVDVGRDGADARHRDLLAGALPRRASSPTPQLSDLWKDVFLFHWKEESQHAILDELEWRARERPPRRRGARPGRRRSDRARRRRRRDRADAGERRCRATSSPPPDARSAPPSRPRSASVVLSAYRWQYIVSGAQEPRFGEVLTELTTSAQMERIGAALGPIVAFTAQSMH